MIAAIYARKSTEQNGIAVWDRLDRLDRLSDPLSDPLLAPLLLGE